MGAEENSFSVLMYLERSHWELKLPLEHRQGDLIMSIVGIAELLLTNRQHQLEQKWLENKMKNSFGDLL